MPNYSLDDPNNLSQAHIPYWEQIDELQQLYGQAPCRYPSLDKQDLYISSIRINQTELEMLGYCSEDIVGEEHFFDPSV